MKKSILKVVHQSAQRLHKAGLIDKQTMHKFDAKCLSPVKKFSPKEIKNIREKEKISQPIFALHLNISASTVKK